MVLFQNFICSMIMRLETLFERAQTVSFLRIFTVKSEANTPNNRKIKFKKKDSF